MEEIAKTLTDYRLSYTYEYLGKGRARIVMCTKIGRLRVTVGKGGYRITHGMFKERDATPSAASALGIVLNILEERIY